MIERSQQEKVVSSRPIVQVGQIDQRPFAPALKRELIGDRQPLQEVTPCGYFYHGIGSAAVPCPGSHKQFNPLYVARQQLLQLHVVTHRTAVDVYLRVAAPYYTHRAVVNLYHGQLREHIKSIAEIAEIGPGDS